jgi:hypothetical protein
MDSCTRVTTVRHVWGLLPYPLLPETPALSKIYLILEALRWSDWMPRPVPGQGGRWVGQTGGEILPAHV